MSALERGLALLEHLARHGPQGFSALQERLPAIPKASLARLLKQLVDERYLIKGDGQYRCGDRLGIFASLRPASRHQQLIADWQPVMTDLSQRYGVTVLLLERVGDLLVCIERSLNDFAPPMQALGFRNFRVEHIWLQTLLQTMPPAQWPADAHSPAIAAAIERWQATGYADDAGGFRPDLRRMAFPISDASQRCIAVLGIGGSMHQLTDAVAETVATDVRGLIAQKERYDTA